MKKKQKQGTLQAQKEQKEALEQKEARKEAPEQKAARKESQDALQSVWICGVEGRGEEVVKLLEKRGGRAHSIAARKRLCVAASDPKNMLGIGPFTDDIIFCPYASDSGAILRSAFREITLPERLEAGDILVCKDMPDVFAVFLSFQEESLNQFFRSALCFSACEGVLKKRFPLRMCDYRKATYSEIEYFQKLLQARGLEWDTFSGELVPYKPEPLDSVPYYYIDALGKVGYCEFDESDLQSDDVLLSGNYFQTRELAEEKAREVRKLLRGEATIIEYL